MKFDENWKKGKKMQNCYSLSRILIITIISSKEIKLSYINLSYTVLSNCKRVFLELVELKFNLNSASCKKRIILTS